MKKCMNCLRTFQVIETIREKVVSDKDDDIHNVLDDAKVKFKLFMDNQIRFQVQRTAFTEKIPEMIRSEVEDVAILTID